MRKLVIGMLGLLLSSNAFAFTDLLTMHATKNLIAKVQMEESLEQRAQTLETYKEFLNRRLNAFEMPEDPLTADDGLAREFASLNEFEAYVGNIEIKNLSAKSCSSAKAHVAAASGATQDQLNKGEIASEALLAQEIVSALCH